MTDNVINVGCDDRSAFSFAIDAEWMLCQK